MTKTPQYNIGLAPLNLPAPLTAADGWEKSFTKGKKEVDSAIHGALQAQRHAAHAWAALDEVRRNKDPKATAAGHLGKVEELTKKTLSSVTGRAKAAYDRLKLREAEISKKIVEKIICSDPNAAEIRSILRNMSAKDRSSTILRAIEDHDPSVVSAVLSGLPLMLGMEQKELFALRVLAEKKMAGELVQAREEIQRAATMADSVLRSSRDIAEEAQGSRAAREKFMEDSQRSSEAEAALAGIVQATDQTGFNAMS